MDLATVDVVEVRQWSTPDLSSPGTWPCGICGAPHDVGGSWYVTVRADGASMSCIACDGCAQRASRQLGDGPGG